MLGDLLLGAKFARPTLQGDFCAQQKIAQHCLYIYIYIYIYIIYHIHIYIYPYLLPFVLIKALAGL